MIQLILMILSIISLPGLGVCSILVDSGERFIGVTQASISWGDYDNDGDIDLAVCGLDKTKKPITKIYKNELGTFTFKEDISQKIIGVSYGRVSWQDYDMDGRLDLGIAGYDITRKPTSRIYKNIDGILIEDKTQRPPIRYGNIAWVDTDNDGVNDSYCIAGCDASTNWQPYTKIYRKNKDGKFVEEPQNLIKTYYGAVAWGDYDNDGDMDLVVGGWLPEGAVIKVYNNNQGIFVEDTNQKLVAVFHSSMAFGDYDNDGDVDLVMAGQTMEGKKITVIYRNDNGIFVDDTTQKLPGVNFCCVSWVDYDNDGDLDLSIAGETEKGMPILKIYNNEQIPPVPIHRITIVAKGIQINNNQIMLTTDDTLTLEAKGYDIEGNFVKNVSVQWGVIGNIGKLSHRRAAVVMFDPQLPGTGSIVVNDGRGHVAKLDNIVVTPGKLHHVVIADNNSNHIGHISLCAGDTLTLCAIGYDADNNPIGQLEVNWHLIGDIGTLTDFTGTSTVFHAVKIGTGSIVAVDSVGHKSSTGIIAVNSGALSYLGINEISTQIVEEPFKVVISAYDAMGNIINDHTGPVELYDSGGIIGTATFMFNAGIAIGTLSIPEVAQKISIIAVSNGKKGESNIFNVIGGEITGGMYKDEKETQKLAIAGVPIKAYKRMNNNKLVLKGTTSTNVAGEYVISGIPRGTYTVAIIPPANYQPMLATKIAKVTVPRRIKGAPELMKDIEKINFVLRPLYTDLKQMVVYPNPLKLFTGETREFVFDRLPANHMIKIKIYNIAGELVYESTPQMPGNDQKLTWNAVNNNGDSVASGVYIFCVEDQTGDESIEGKIAVIK